MPEGVRKQKNYNLRKYGITLEQAEKALEDQDGMCAICFKDLELGGAGPDKAYVDHCHQTGRFRALLCSKCNLGIGHFYENTDSLSRAVDYLAFFQARAKLQGEH